MTPEQARAQERRRHVVMWLSQAALDFETRTYRPSEHYQRLMKEAADLLSAPHAQPAQHPPEERCPCCNDTGRCTYQDGSSHPCPTCAPHAQPEAPATCDDVLSAVSDAAKLCYSEANRWDSAAPTTAAHWRQVGMKLQSTSLVLSAQSDQITALQPEAPAPTCATWQPIEMADRYGPPIRLFSRDLIDEDFNPTGGVEGCWQDDVGWLGAVWNAEQDCWDTKVVKPTHWMPLPTPPQEPVS